MAAVERLLIDGERMAAADGRTSLSHDPATGGELATFAEAGAKDVDDAVAAARSAFESPAWRALSPDARGRLLWRVAELLERDAAASASTPASPPDGPPRRGGRVRLHGGRSAGIVVGLIAICCYLAATQPVFLTWGNFTNIVQANSVTLALALGATVVIIAGGIDLSAASAMALAGIALALSLQAQFGALLSVVIAVAVGVLLGAVNGVLISYLRISFLVVTLGTLSVFASIALVMSDGKTITTFGLPGFESIYDFTLKSLLGVPAILIFDVILVLLGALILRYTAFGRAVFAVGSNREAARLNGINVSRTTFFVYVLAGALAAVGAILSTSRLTAAAPVVDATLLLTVIAAVLIGGTAYTGGEGGRPGDGHRCCLPRGHSERPDARVGLSLLAGHCEWSCPDSRRRYRRSARLRDESSPHSQLPSSVGPVTLLRRSRVRS